MLGVQLGGISRRASSCECVLVACAPASVLSVGAGARRGTYSVAARAPPERDMNVFTQTPRDEPRATHFIEIVEPDPLACEPSGPPEGLVQRNYRLLDENIRAYTPTGDSKGSLLTRYDVCAAMSPPRSRILELLRPEDPGRDALEAIVRPVPRRGLTRPLDEDTRRFLQRALQSPQAVYSSSTTQEPHHRPPEPSEEPASPADETSHKSKNSALERSLADELREAEEEALGTGARRELLREWRRGGGMRGAMERERLGRLALAVEDDEEEGALSATARRLDALLATSRDLHAELADIHADLQASSVRARRCTAAARALGAEARALRYLDDVVALLRGDVAAAARARAWPFALGRRQPGRNYVI